MSRFTLGQLFAAVSLAGTGAGLFAIMFAGRIDLVALPIVGAFAGGLVGAGIGPVFKVHSIAGALAGVSLGFIVGFIAIDGLRS